MEKSSHQVAAPPTQSQQQQVASHQVNGKHYQQPRMSQSHNHSQIQVSSQSAKHQKASTGSAAANATGHQTTVGSIIKPQLHVLQYSASQSHNASTAPAIAQQSYHQVHNKKKSKKNKPLSSTGPTSAAMSISEAQNIATQQRGLPLQTSSYNPHLLGAQQQHQQMLNQVHTYSFVNAHNYLDEPGTRPMTKSQENSLVAKHANSNNNSHRAITQAHQVALLSAAHTDQSFSQEGNRHSDQQQILAAGIAPHSSAKVIVNSQASSHKTKHKKSAKKSSNAMGSLSSASTAAVVGGGVNAQAGLSLQQSPLLNGQYGISKNQAPGEQAFGGVFGSKPDNLNSKTSNYYTVINQTLASQVASSMHDVPFVNGEIKNGGPSTTQASAQPYGAPSQQVHRRDLPGSSAGLHHELAGMASSSSYWAHGKRKKTSAAHTAALTQSMKEQHTPVHEPTGQSEAAAHQRNVQTSIDWKHSKKKGLGLIIHNTSGQQTQERVKEKGELLSLQDSVIQHQQSAPSKTQSGRPANKKLAAQSIVERIQKNNAAQAIQLHSLHPGATGQPNSGQQSIGKKSGKQSIGVSGRNRTATALLGGSASANGDPLHHDQQHLNQPEGKGSTLHKNSNASHSRKDHYQLLSQEQDTAGKHLLISQNVIDRKKRLKTSQGTKSGGFAGQGNPTSSKLPLMHTLDHQNQLSFLKNSKDRSAHSNQMLQAKQQATMARGHKSKGLTDNEIIAAVDSFSISDDGKHSAHMPFKKPMGFVKKTRTQVTSNAVSAAVGIAGVAFGTNTAATSSPQGKKQRKQKSLANGLVPQPLSQKNAASAEQNNSISQNELSPGNREPLFLPHTGIDFPFLKKRPQFIRDAPDFELIHSGNNARFVTTASASIQHVLSRASDFNARVIYDCTFGGGGTGNGPVMSAAPGGGHTSGVTALQAGQLLNGRYFDRLNSYYNLKGSHDTTLIFESRFESGNLHRATQVGEYEYELELKFDHGSPQQMSQWYYFRVGNTRKNQQYKFNIVNLIKPDSLYNHGQKPLVYSKKDAETRQIGWHRSCSDIKYYPSKKRSMASPQNFYTLAFSIEFQNDHDQVYFAHCYPYTYSDCILFLKRVCLPSYGKDRLRRTALCKTKAGNSVEMLIITNFLSSQDQIADRKCVILSARVHPGESNSSFAMEGIVDMMLSDEREARILRDTFVFKIVPMLNPDGVIVGNYRCSLSGLDLNRQWMNPVQKSAPEIVSMKEMVRKTLECRDIHLFVDIHGHSRAKNLFMYGCQQTGPNGKPLMIHDKKGLLAHKEKVLPVLQARQMDYFSFEGSSFNVQKCKESTGRVVMHREFGIIHSYTLEISFCGATQGVLKDTHFSQKVLKDIGKNFCKALVKFSDPATYRDALREVEERINGNQNPLSKSNYSMQLEPHERQQQLQFHHPEAATSTAKTTATAASQQMVLVTGSLSQKARQPHDPGSHNSKHPNSSNQALFAWSSGLDSRQTSHQVK